ncbi:MAG TPA: deoxyribonuclease V [bacterium]|nr:deoxyribonuclease V [bacterium]
MVIPELHRWDLPPRDAIDLQTQLASRIVLKDEPGEIRTVAGADLSIDTRSGTGYGGVIVFEFPSLREIERVSATGPLTFPYIPGLLSFREGPILLKAFERLTNTPDVLLFDGQGIAHPRRLGIASHLGLILNRPSIGCGKSLLCGRYQEPGPSKGDTSPLEDNGEVVGTVLRTRDRVKPVFVSPGHRISPARAVKIILQCTDGYRIPKPTRLADHFVGSIKRP